MMTKRLYHIVNLDTGAGYYFQAITPMDAMTQLRYTLSLRDGYLKDRPISKTESGSTLYLDTLNGTWAVQNRIKK